MSTNHAFDVVTLSKTGDEVKLGRTWLREKQGQQSLSFDLSSLPLAEATVQLVSVDPWDPTSAPEEFHLKMPVNKGEGSKTYWHHIGLVKAREGDAKRPYEVVFNSIPLIGNLVAFPPRAPKNPEDEIPFGK